MRVLGYVRVSTDEQTTDSQRLAITQYASAHNLPVQFAEDAGFSGADDDRPAFQALLSDPPDVLIVYRLDRLTRSLSTLVHLIADLKKTRIISVTESLDFSTPMGRCMVAMLGTFAQYEREVISERVKAGLKAAKSNGKVLGRPRNFNEKSPRTLAVMADINAGERVADIAARHGISYQHVLTIRNNYCPDAKMNLKRGRPRHPRREEAAALVASGKSVAEVAALVGVSIVTVYNWSQRSASALRRKRDLARARAARRLEARRSKGFDREPSSEPKLGHDDLEAAIREAKRASGEFDP